MTVERKTLTTAADALVPGHPNGPSQALTLLGGVSLSPHAARVHSLKNGLAVVYAVQRLLEDDVAGQSRVRLARAQNSVRRMLGVLEEDLAQNAQPVKPIFCAVADVVDAMVGRVQDRAETGAVALSVCCGPGDVLGIRDELVEAFANVVLNAIEVTPPGGAVFVSTRETSDRTQFWTVQDTGPGMSEGVMAELGTPRYSRKKGGWGLGLAVARSIVQRHGGLVRVESSPGSGTVVTMCIPFREESDEG
jgi:signal transduction histidine kinase